MRWVAKTLWRRAGRVAAYPCRLRHLQGEAGSACSWSASAPSHVPIDAPDSVVLTVFDLRRAISRDLDLLRPISRQTRPLTAPSVRENRRLLARTDRTDRPYAPRRRPLTP